MENIFPGIDLYLAKGHSYGTQVVRVKTKNGRYVVTGDAAYTLENIITMTPMGYGIDQLDQLQSFEKILMLADGNINNVIPAHDLDWKDCLTELRLSHRINCGAQRKEKNHEKEN